jgi:hypothetical protein
MKKNLTKIPDLPMDFKNLDGKIHRIKSLRQARVSRKNLGFF